MREARSQFEKNLIRQALARTKKYNASQLNSVTASEKAEALLDAVAAGAAGYVTKRVSARELRHAVVTVYSGGSIITPTLAGHLLREYSQVSRGEPMHVRPLLGQLSDRARLPLFRMNVHLGPRDVHVAAEHQLQTALPDVGGGPRTRIFVAGSAGLTSFQVWALFGPFPNGSAASAA